MLPFILALLKIKIHLIPIPILLLILEVNKRNLSLIFIPISLIIDGGEGTYLFGALGRKISKGLTMKEFGDCVGVCMHY